jgi:hypothetical protein
MADPPLTGRCLCERVRFQVTEPLLGAAYCHCKRCQRRTGTAFSVSGLTVPGSFEITEGEEFVDAFRPDDGWHKYFCTKCGGQLYTQSNEDPRLISVRMGALDEDPGVRPALHQFVAYAAPWDELPDDGLPRFDERMPADMRSPE